MHFFLKVNKVYFVFIFLLFIILTPAQKTFADEAYVYCTTKNRQWNWLHDKSVKVSGEWKEIFLRSTKYFQYFKIDGGRSLVMELKNQCKKEFGQDFIYVQPAENAMGFWFVFGYSDDTYEPGLYDYIMDLPRFR